MTLTDDTRTGSAAAPLIVHFGAGGPAVNDARFSRGGASGASGAPLDVNRLEARTGTAFVLRAGQSLAVIAPMGEQVSDVFCVAADDHDEWLSSGRTFDRAGSVAVATGTVLHSNRGRPMATVVEDTCGRHDFLLAPCSQETFDLLHPERRGAPHPSCLENLSASMARFGVDPDRISTTLSLFMNVWTEQNGALHVDTPSSRPGDRVVLRAQLDLVVGLTACSAKEWNNGVCKPIDYRVDA